MKHYTPEHWSDYVRGLVAQAEAESMDRHLADGCRRCERQVGALRSVLRIAETDLRFEPPASVLRSARNLFRAQQLIEEDQKPTVNLRLHFDSFLAPALAGTRGAVTESRHLLYESSEFTLDLQVDAGNRAEGVCVVGQVLDADSVPIADVPAFLSEGVRIFSLGLSGSMGEFRLLADAESSPRLNLLIGDEQLVDLELPRPASLDTEATH